MKQCKKKHPAMARIIDSQQRVSEAAKRILKGARHSKGKHDIIIKKGYKLQPIELAESRSSPAKEQAAVDVSLNDDEEEMDQRDKAVSDPDQNVISHASSDTEDSDTEDETETSTQSGADKATIEGNVKQNVSQVHVVQTGINEYTCSFCKFTNEERMKVHEHIRKVHMNVKPYICQFCKESFFSKIQCSLHMQKCVLHGSKATIEVSTFGTATGKVGSSQVSERVPLLRKEPLLKADFYSTAESDAPVVIVEKPGAKKVKAYFSPDGPDGVIKKGARAVSLLDNIPSDKGVKAIVPLSKIPALSLLGELQPDKIATVSSSKPPHLTMKSATYSPAKRAHPILLTLIPKPTSTAPVSILPVANISSAVKKEPPVIATSSSNQPFPVFLTNAKTPGGPIMICPTAVTPITNAIKSRTKELIMKDLPHQTAAAEEVEYRPSHAWISPTESDQSSSRLIKVVTPALHSATGKPGLHVAQMSKVALSETSEITGAVSKTNVGSRVVTLSNISTDVNEEPIIISHSLTVEGASQAIAKDSFVTSPSIAFSAVAKDTKLVTSNVDSSAVLSKSSTTKDIRQTVTAKVQSTQDTSSKASSSSLSAMASPNRLSAASIIAQPTALTSNVTRPKAPSTAMVSILAPKTTSSSAIAQPIVTLPKAAYSAMVEPGVATMSVQVVQQQSKMQPKEGAISPTITPITIEPDPSLALQ